MLHDEGSRQFKHPAEYMYHETPNVQRTLDSAGALLKEMDRFGIERGLVSIDPTDEPRYFYLSMAAYWSAGADGQPVPRTRRRSLLVLP
jgi:hypothetical protein